MNEKMPTNHYANHLADVNQSNKVIVREDIYNSNGALLIKAGLEVDADTAQRISQHKIAKPIEVSVELEQSVSPKTLKMLFLEIPNHPEVKAIFEAQLDTTSFDRECDSIERYPLIAQKLTVFAKKFPELFQKTTMAAFIGLLICEELKLDQMSTHCVFIASLCQDLGLLHIDPEIIQMKGTMSAEQWKLLQGHVVVGYHFLTLVPNLPKLAIRAVVEHHERTDGFGYPRNRQEAQLCPEGQIVAIVDTTIALFNKYVLGLGYSLNAMSPIMQINSGVHMHSNTQALLRIFKRYFEPMKTIHNRREMEKMVNQMIERGPYVNNWLSVTTEFNSELSSRFENEQIGRTTEMINRIQSVLITSGVSDDSLINWLKELATKGIQERDFAEVEILGLMFGEAAWQLGELLKQMILLVDILQKENNDFSAEVQRIEFLKQLYIKIKSPII
jgi:HD-GYP domain-containing protein (c-di-GMP phosphodiesterase class II)